MRRLRILAVALFGLCLSAVSSALPQATQLPAEKKVTHVWTNEDIERLREKRGISVFGMPPIVELENRKPTPATPSYDKEKDPSWYRAQLSPLRSRLNHIDTQIQGLQKYRSITAYMVGGIIVPQLAGLPLNPEGQIKQLEARRLEIVERINSIEDLARHNDIPPGEIR
jgi:hypothetical protein